MGCKCKKSGCRLKYCKCFLNNVPCSEFCTCKNCANCLAEESECAQKIRNQILEGKTNVKNLNPVSGKSDQNSKKMFIQKEIQETKRLKTHKMRNIENQKTHDEKYTKQKLNWQIINRKIGNKIFNQILNTETRNISYSEYFSTKKIFNSFPHKKTQENLIGMMEALIRSRNAELNNNPHSMEKIKNVMFRILNQFESSEIRSFLLGNSQNKPGQMPNPHLKIKNEVLPLNFVELDNIFTIRKSNLNKVWGTLGREGAHFLVNKILSGFYKQIQKSQNCFLSLNSEDRKAEKRKGNPRKEKNGPKFDSVSLKKVKLQIENERVSFEQILNAKFSNRTRENFENKTSVDENKNSSLNQLLNKRNSHEF